MALVISPIATGNGAYVVHKTLEHHLPNYKVVPYHPYRTFFPLSLWPLGRFSRADLIHTTPDYAIFHRRRNVPIVITFHNYVLDAFMAPYSSTLQNIHYSTNLRWFKSLAVNKAHTITAVSHFTANLAKYDLGLEKDIRVIYNGVDEQVFFPANCSRVNSDSIKVLFCGNLTRRKGVQWLLPIADKLNAGIEIHYTAGLRTNDSLAYHPRIRCLGKISYADMPDVYRQADLLLFPSVREGLSLAALEAMACGLPVVATHCSSLPELIDEGKGGFLCPLGDVQIFADKINQLADDARLRREMGEYNRTRIEKAFTLERMVKEYRYLFDEVLDTR